MLYRRPIPPTCESTPRSMKMTKTAPIFNLKGTFYSKKGLIGVDLSCVNFKKCGVEGLRTFNFSELNASQFHHLCNWKLSCETRNIGQSVHLPALDAVQWISSGNFKAFKGRQRKIREAASCQNLQMTDDGSKTKEKLILQYTSNNILKYFKYYGVIFPSYLLFLL